MSVHDVTPEEEETVSLLDRYEVVYLMHFEYIHLLPREKRTNEQVFPPDLTSITAVKPLPDDKVLYWSKLKQTADDILKCIKYKKISAIHVYGRKHCEKRRNCLLQGISPFLTMFSTAIYL